jgi:hypothetical protein
MSRNLSDLYPGTTPLSAGDGIDITDNVASVKVDGVTVDFNSAKELEVIGGGGGGTTEYLSVNGTAASQSMTQNVAKKVIYSTVVTDTETAYDDETGEYTIPADGKYLVIGSIGLITAIAFGGGEARIYIDGSQVALGCIHRPYQMQIVDILDLDAGDKLTIYGVVYDASNELDGNVGSTFLRIHRLS